MTRRKTVFSALCLVMVAGLLASCDSERPTAVDQDQFAAKREFIGIEGDDGGGGGGTPPPPPAEPTLPDQAFLAGVVAAYDGLAMKSVAITVDMTGDTVIVPLEGYAIPLIAMVAANPGAGLPDPRTFYVEYPSAEFDPLDPPKVPGGVSLYTFYQKPSSDDLELFLPPAPWYDATHLGYRCSFYEVKEIADGSYIQLGDIEIIESASPMAIVKVPLAPEGEVHPYPDNPSRGLLDPEEPGEDPEDT